MNAELKQGYLSAGLFQLCERSNQYNDSAELFVSRQDFQDKHVACFLFWTIVSCPLHATYPAIAMCLRSEHKVTGPGIRSAI